MGDDGLEDCGDGWAGGAEGKEVTSDSGLGMMLGLYIAMGGESKKEGAAQTRFVKFDVFDDFNIVAMP